MEIIAKNLDNLIFICILILFFVAVYFSTKEFFFIFLKRTDIDNELVNNIVSKTSIFLYLFYLIPVPILYFLSFLFISIQFLIQKIVLVYTYTIVILLLLELLTIIYEIYSSYKISKKKPIKVFIQMGKILIIAIGGIAIISVILNISFISLMSAIGALTAVLMFIFKDSLLSFKAGIQLIVNDMLRIEDWLEIPKYGADGFVTEISLDTIKVRNWDKTITFIPTFKLMEDSFKNWRGMEEMNARRIARSILIDQHSVRFLKKEEIEYLKKFSIIENYLTQRENEVKEKKASYDKYLTNLGTFRIYILNYLKNHADIINDNEDLLLMVRQLEPTPYGIPLQIYAFVNSPRILKYEQTQADIFDHILAIMPEFNIKLYQVISK